MAGEVLVGLGGYYLIDKSQRPHGMAIAIQLIRGYPYSALLALVLLLLIVVAPIGKVRSIVKGWEDAQIPIVIKRLGGRCTWPPDRERSSHAEEAQAELVAELRRFLGDQLLDAGRWEN